MIPVHLKTRCGWQLQSISLCIILYRFVSSIYLCEAPGTRKSGLRSVFEAIGCWMYRLADHVFCAHTQTIMGVGSM